MMRGSAERQSRRATVHRPLRELHEVTRNVRCLAMSEQMAALQLDIRGPRGVKAIRTSLVYVS